MEIIATYCKQAASHIALTTPTDHLSTSVKHICACATKGHKCFQFIDWGTSGSMKTIFSSELNVTTSGDRMSIRKLDATFQQVAPTGRNHGRNEARKRWVIIGRFFRPNWRHVKTSRTLIYLANEVNEILSILVKETDFLNLYYIENLSLKRHKSIISLIFK